VDRKRDNLPVKFRRFTEIKSRPIEWLWPQRFAKGKYSLLAGPPGLGKSQITCSMAAIITTGGVWPTSRDRCEVGSVIFITCEDDPEDTIKPRLEATGADMERCYFLDHTRTFDGDGNPVRATFNLNRDVGKLEEMVDYVGNVSAVFIDPITAYSAGSDSFKTTDVRAMLAPIQELAQEQSFAFIAVSHPNKDTSQAALDRITGSNAYGAAARAAYLIYEDKDEPGKRMMLPAKNNIGNDTEGFSYSIQGYTTSDGYLTSRVVWSDELVSRKAQDMTQHGGDGASAIDEAIDFLKEELSAGPVLATEVISNANSLEISKRTLDRAKKELSVQTKKGFDRKFRWSLPGES